MQYVYILHGRNGKLYTGCTSNLRNRLIRHQSGNVEATKDLLPVKLTIYVAFKDKYKAYKFEKYLKTGSGSAFLRKPLI